MKAGNLFDNIPADLAEELFEKLAGNEAVTIERIVSQGHSTAKDQWYDQERNEWVILLQGRAKLGFEEGGEIVELVTGDHLTIPAHTRHKVLWTSDEIDTIWLAVHY